MARVIQTTLFTAILAYTVEAHVRGLPTGFGCRNCNGKVAPGPFSQEGPLSGQLKFGSNGVNKVAAGQVVKLAIGYNGAHQDNVKNFFFLRYVCGSGVNDPKNFEKVGPVNKNVINCNPPCTQMTAAEILSVDGQPVTKDTYPIEAIKSARDGHSISFQMPNDVVTKMSGTGPENFCTFALVEGRNWGVGWDFRINTGMSPTLAPLSRSLSGVYTLNKDNCAKDSPDCKCMSGKITVKHIAGSNQAKALIDIKDYPKMVITLKEKAKLPGALGAKFILSNCNNPYDQILDINLSPFKGNATISSSQAGYLNAAIVDNEPSLCSAVVVTRNTATEIGEQNPIKICANCKNVKHWRDKDGDSCRVYKSCLKGEWRTKNTAYYQQFQADDGQDSLSALEACCECGGGQGEYGRPSNTTTPQSLTVQTVTAKSTRPKATGNLSVGDPDVKDTTTAASCANRDCGANGLCTAGRCVCLNGFSGEVCAIPPGGTGLSTPAVDNGQAVSDAAQMAVKVTAALAMISAIITA